MIDDACSNIHLISALWSEFHCVLLGISGEMVGVKSSMERNTVLFILLISSLVMIIIAKIRQNVKFQFLILSFYKGKGVIQPFKDERLMMSAASILLLFNFLIMIGIFGHYSVKIFGVEEALDVGEYGFLKVSLFVSSCYVVKLIAIRMVQFLIGADKGSSEYLYTVVHFCQNLGLVLFPFIVTATYFESEYKLAVINAAIVAIILLYLFRLFKTIAISVRESVPILYLFLYLCAFEFLPLTVAVKLVAERI